MTKIAALTKTNPLDEARAEVERRRQRRDVDLAQYGPAQDNDISDRNRHLRKRYETHQQLVRQAEAAVSRLELAELVAGVKADAQAAVQSAREKWLAVETAVEPAAKALDDVTARASALEDQIAQLQAGPGAGLDVAQDALAECTRAGDQTGAAAAAEEIARIEAPATATDARLRPLQLQLAEVEKMKASAQQRADQAREEERRAWRIFRNAQLEELAVARDEAAIALREAQTAYDVANQDPVVRRTKNLPIEFTIGASHRLLTALGKSVGDSMPVTDRTLQHDRQEHEFIDESIFEVNPLALEDLAARIARDRADPRHRPEKIDKARRANAYASVKQVDFATACRDLGFVGLGFDVDELASLQNAMA